MYDCHRITRETRTCLEAQWCPSAHRLGTTGIGCELCCTVHAAEVQDKSINLTLQGASGPHKMICCSILIQCYDAVKYSKKWSEIEITNNAIDTS